MEVTIVDHPLVKAHLTQLRRSQTPPPQFRQSLETLGGLLIYEALRDTRAQAHEVETPLAASPGSLIIEPPLLVPVLRAGLGMLGSAQRLLPGAGVGFIGIRRNEETFEPQPYLNTVPNGLKGQSAVVLEPMLATGGSLACACGLLKDAGAGSITVVCVLAAPQGVAALESASPYSRLFAAAVDDGLDEKACIVPGLGDAGDRQFEPALSVF